LALQSISPRPGSSAAAIAYYKHLSTNGARRLFSEEENKSAADIQRIPHPTLAGT
jgi:hypothetical protein